MAQTPEIWRLRWSCAVKRMWHSVFGEQWCWSVESKLSEASLCVSFRPPVAARVLSCAGQHDSRPAVSSRDPNKNIKTTPIQLVIHGPGCIMQTQPAGWSSNQSTFLSPANNNTRQSAVARATTYAHLENRVFKRLSLRHRWLAFDWWQ